MGNRSLNARSDESRVIISICSQPTRELMCMCNRMGFSIYIFIKYMYVSVMTAPRRTQGI